MDMGFAFREVCFPNETPLKRTDQLVVVSRLWVGDYIHISAQGHSMAEARKFCSQCHRLYELISASVLSFKGLVSLVSSIQSGSYNFSES